MEVEVLDLDQREPPLEPKRKKTRGVGLAGVCLAIVVGLQLIPDPPAVETTSVSSPVPADPAVEVGISAPFQWLEVGGLDRFEIVTMPVTTDTGFLAVGNPLGISGAASVVVSDDGSQWNRWGTIHGVGGEVEISDVERSSDGYRAFGTYTESMPKTEYAIHERIPAVWSSENGIRWERQDMTSTLLGVALTLDAAISPTDSVSDSLHYLGHAGDAEAFLLTSTTPSVSVRQPGIRGDPFATRVDEATQSLLITTDQVQWASEVVPFDRIDFVGDVDGKFLLRAWPDAESTESSFWLVIP